MDKYLDVAPFIQIALLFTHSYQ